MEKIQDSINGKNRMKSLPIKRYVKAILAMAKISNESLFNTTLFMLTPLVILLLYMFFKCIIIIPIFVTSNRKIQI